eukprot:TRINITY_DN90766_c0_g1_i1.p1 TRINITY_DN90766_c0_g1~~TRINITY_DN90766_c0_g1_i1.p1  ORF type:complete len:493 (+),score=36.23 TRINITY_DN90766_c0_g1_i1:100-1578(+)
MREIIQLQIGQCGNTIGSKAWEAIIEEHRINPETGKCDHPQKGELDVCFSEEYKGRYIPRALFIDLESTVLDTILSRPISKLYRPGNFIDGKMYNTRVWARGYYTEGAEFIDSVLDPIRKEVERCETLQGFQITHSIGGGTGGGLGSLLTTKLKEEYPSLLTSTFSIFPSSKVSDYVIEPYNGTASIPYLDNNSDLAYVIDNEALFDICVHKLGISKPTYDDINRAAVLALTNLTSMFRFKTSANSDMLRLASNLIPFPHLHFFTIGVSPIVPPLYYTVTDSIADIFRDNMLIAADPKYGRYLAAATLFRGDALYSTADINSLVLDYTNKYSANFSPWIPDSVKTSICKVSPPGLTHSAMSVSNTTSVHVVFSRLRDQFTALFKRKAFLCNATGEGMDEMEFEDASCTLGDLISEYQQYDHVDMCADNGITKESIAHLLTKFDKLTKYDEDKKWGKVLEPVKKQKTKKKRVKQMQDNGMKMVFYLYANGLLF